MTDEQIKYMRDRFLNWELPKTLNPDGGITFKRSESAIKYNHPWPVGTNFLNADEAEAMVRHMIEGLPCRPALTREDAEKLADTAIQRFTNEYAMYKNEIPFLREVIADALQRVAGEDTRLLNKLETFTDIQIWRNQNGKWSMTVEDDPKTLIEADTIRAAIEGEKK